MSTRSLIRMQTKNGIEAIYCHFDGYPEHHGPVLVRHYATADAVAALLDLGDLSVLGPQVGRRHKFATHGENAEAQEWCLACGRDRGDKDAGRRAYATEAEFLAAAPDRWAEYVYLFRDGRWSFRKVGKDEAWQPLEGGKAD